MMDYKKSVNLIKPSIHRPWGANCIRIGRNTMQSSKSNHHHELVFLFLITSQLVFSLVTTTTVSCTSSSVSTNNDDEVEDESEFSYVKGSETGPEKWGKIKAEWKSCGKGKLQSPIDLGDKRVIIIPNKGQLKQRYKPAHAVLKNRGHDVAVEWKGNNNAGKIVLSGVPFKLQQCHWHTPSEHRLNGTKFEMEVHMVHKSAWGQIAVIGNIYKYGAPDPFLAKMLKNVTSMSGGEEKDIGIVNPEDITYWSKRYYRYIGSLTTPPCTEGVIWTISKKVKTVSKDQVEGLRRVVHDGHKGNARPNQKLNGRPVLLYIPFHLN